MSSLTGATVLITGGTGTFGQSVAKKLLAQTKVGKIVIYSRDEKKQYDMSQIYKNKKLSFVIGDIRDRNSTINALSGVDFVFHAAALKQVPSCEYHPIEAVKTNILGTENVLYASSINNVKKVVVLSTDKAAYPVNAMGCSKLMMEKIMISYSRISNQNTIYCGVRYGNVLFSRGSVIPLFLRQAIQQEDLTITHEKMTRFLMPLQDAIDLVIYTLEHGSTGDIYVKKAQAGTIVDLAQACIKLTNSSSNLRYIGIRPGEKLHETLATSEELARAEDKGNYWRITASNENYQDEFFEGDKSLENIKPFDSLHAHQINVNEIVSLIKDLEEMKNFQ